MAASMPDHYVLLLEKVVAENKALREKVTIMSNNDKQTLSELHKKIDSLKATSSSKRVRQTGGSSTRVPKMCRVSSNYRFQL